MEPFVTPLVFLKNLIDDFFLYDMGYLILLTNNDFCNIYNNF